MGSGLPPRRAELTGITWCNGETARNIYLHYNLVAVITGYHKSQWHQPHARPSYVPPSAFSPNPPSGSRRRNTPRGIFLSTWNRSGVYNVTSNASYGLRDCRDRINRRVSKEDESGRVMLGGNFDIMRTACRHEHIDYIPRYQNMMTKEQVDTAIMPLLRAVDDPMTEDQSPTRQPRLQGQPGQQGPQGGQSYHWPEIL
ncbi:MAG: hypothetical protein FRX48_09642 [Lasallia pustulata]|uniref:Uncharacterized protein n=1 Tax=Lasallia pustulata TaxID=136370 RepID=A0A5M8PBC9_9LECA|nr:MAG: hypothetical protein FRX48_09642 [Lasallia pustulata]